MHLEIYIFVIQQNHFKTINLLFNDFIVFIGLSDQDKSTFMYFIDFMCNMRCEK